MKRVVLDTNVVASACFWRGVCWRCLEAWVGGDKEHVQAAGDVRGIPVLSPTRFLEILQDTGR